MASIFGENIKLSIFGESHSKGIGGVIDGIEAGFKIDFESLQLFIDKRRPGQKLTTGRIEEDKPIFYSGILDNTTTGSPIGFIIENNNQKPTDYESLKEIYRPSHADYPADVKYKGLQDKRGGGHFSGRLTAPIVVVGGIALQILEKENINVQSEIISINGNSENPIEEIEKAKRLKDSVGGIIKTSVTGLKPGLGGVKDSSIEAKLAFMVFSAIPGIKGIEFGAGFKAAQMKGSEYNDPYRYEDGKIIIDKNNSGGVLGGISTGADLVFNIAVKPTPSIGIEQDTVNFKNKENVKLKIEGRHDPSIVLRVRPVIKALTAFTILDILKDWCNEIWINWREFKPFPFL